MKIPAVNTRSRLYKTLFIPLEMLTRKRCMGHLLFQRYIFCAQVGFRVFLHSAPEVLITQAFINLPYAVIEAPDGRSQSLHSLTTQAAGVTTNVPKVTRLSAAAAQEGWQINLREPPVKGTISVQKNPNFAE